MRRELGTAVRRQFEAALRKRLPGYVPDTDAIVPAGCRVWRAQHSPRLTTFVMLFIHPRRDHFTLDGAWSTKHGRYPNTFINRFPRDWPEMNIKRDGDVDGEFRFRIPHLWQPRDFWWKLVTDVEWRRYADHMMCGPDFPPELPLEPSLARIPSAVDDAISKTIEYFVPYLDSVIEDTSG